MVALNDKNPAGPLSNIWALDSLHPDVSARAFLVLAGSLLGGLILC